MNTIPYTRSVFILKIRRLYLRSTYTIFHCCRFLLYAAKASLKCTELFVRLEFTLTIAVKRVPNETCYNEFEKDMPLFDGKSITLHFISSCKPAPPPQSNGQMENTNNIEFKTRITQICTNTIKLQPCNEDVRKTKKNILPHVRCTQTDEIHTFPSQLRTKVIKSKAEILRLYLISTVYKWLSIFFRMRTNFAARIVCQPNLYCWWKLFEKLTANNFRQFIFINDRICVDVSYTSECVCASVYVVCCLSVCVSHRVNLV